ncbi:MAG: hypothetical protein U9R79_09690 [Armatimonadota bacterium]|nr:hypothetical protein [Armatimonadota bacterium]
MMALVLLFWLIVTVALLVTWLVRRRRSRAPLRRTGPTLAYLSLGMGPTGTAYIAIVMSLYGGMLSPSA